MGKLIDLTGQKFNRLTVLKRTGTKNQSALWLCQCNCGKTLETTSSRLIQKQTKSCGCLNKELTIQRNINGQKEKGYSSYTALFKQYYYSAKKFNRDFQLTRKEFILITQKKCFYCNCEPKEYNKYKWNKKISSSAFENAKIVANGIDRIDNTKGYIYENCVSCCFTCNAMKSDLTMGQFTSHIKKVIRHVG